MLSYHFTLPSSSISFKSRFFLDSFTGRSSYQSIVLSGPLGSLSFICPSSFVWVLSGSHLSLFVYLPFSPILFRSFVSLFLNALKGVHSGFSLSLNLSGVGFKANLVNDRLLALSLGFSHPVLVPIPSFISLSCPSPSSILASSFHLPLLSQFLHSIRLIRPADKDHYNSKGLSLA